MPYIPEEAEGSPGLRALRALRMDLAVSAFERAIAANLQDLDSLALLAHTHVIAAHGEAAAAVERLRGVAPSHPALASLSATLQLRQGDAQALEPLRRAAERAGATAFDWLYLGMAERQRGNAPGALDALERALGADSSLAVVHFERCVAFTALGDRERAVLAARQGLALAPDVPSLRRVLLDALALAGRPGEALAEADRLLALMPTDAALQQLRFQLLLDSGNTPEALKVAMAWRQANPTSPDVTYSHAVALAARRLFAQARPLFEASVAALPQEAEPKRGLARCLIELGDEAQAATLLDAALATHPASLGVRNDLARIALNHRDGAKAERVLRPAHAADPTHAVTRVNLASALVLQKKLGEVSALLQPVLAGADATLRSAAQALIAEAASGPKPSAPAGARGSGGLAGRPSAPKASLPPAAKPSVPPATKPSAPPATKPSAPAAAKPSGPAAAKPSAPAAAKRR